MVQLVDSPDHRKPSHILTDLILLICISFTIWYYGNGDYLFNGFCSWCKSIPFSHYQPVFDFTSKPMDPALAWMLWIIDMYFLVKTYYLERMVVTNAHKKFKAHGNTAIVAVHGIGSSLEFCIGLAAVLNPDKPYLAKITALLALCVNVPSGFMLTPRVFGVKHLTVPGFYKYGWLRVMESVRVLNNPLLVPNLWILLKVGTVVRLLGYFVLPYSSIDAIKEGKRGDLFTEPVIYSFNILLSGYLVAAFVYPPEFLLGSLIVYVVGQWFYPPRISRKRLLTAAREPEASTNHKQD